VPAGRRSVAILLDDLGRDAGADAADTILQAETVAAALADLGFACIQLPVSLDLESARRQLRQIDPSFVFNLVESLAGTGRLLHLVPAMLEVAGLPFTGSSAEAVYVTNAKPLSKRLMAAAGIATPDWQDAASAGGAPPPEPGPWIVKSVAEHASIGLDDEAVVRDAALLPALIAKRRRAIGGDWFVEQFVEGREFNVALLAGPQGPEVLPIAEMCFVNFPPGKPRIVDYAAKWQADSFGYNNTPRNFDLPAADAPLLSELRDISLACWRLFDLKGYVRVDFRVDAEGKPWVLEVNANPCISPDAGFAAAAARRGLSSTDIVARIIADLSNNIGATA
jgi:D-alanine-D-alanine ligase